MGVKTVLVLVFIISVAAAVRVFFRSRGDLALEVLALRQQVAVLKRQRPRPALNPTDRFFWITLRRLWPRSSDVLLIVKPETLVAWHRAGFRLFWRWRCRPRGGRPKITDELRTLIRTMATENVGWGAPKIHGELLKLLKLGFDAYWSFFLVSFIIAPKQPTWRTGFDLAGLFSSFCRKITLPRYG